MAELAVHIPGVVAEDRIAVATQWQLMWWRFRKHKLAVGGTIVLVAFYLVALFADFFAYVDPTESEAQRSLMAPQPIHWIDEGSFKPFVYALKVTRTAHVLACLCSRYEHQDTGHVLSAMESRGSYWFSSRPIAICLRWKAPRLASRCS